MKSIRHSKIATRALSKFDSKTRCRLEEAILAIADDPLVGKKLKGDFGREKLISLRVWPYRIIYRFESHFLDIIYIEHRKDVYR